MPIVAIQSLSQLRIFVFPRTTPRQSSLPMGFPRQEYWSGLPFPSPGDLPKLGINLTSLALAGRLFTTEPPEKPFVMPISTVINIFRNDMPSQLQI